MLFILCCIFYTPKLNKGGVAITVVDHLLQFWSMCVGSGYFIDHHMTHWSTSTEDIQYDTLLDVGMTLH